ncbi:hypothetical protein ATZ36_09015 [Candidatus Endomicrobiellum trichonymphae]|jgi:hypothetical protein|uniref:Uncharacterized protein n=1 Tax=Endomicrobium trichonymphae TaxID=1408204 RepID=A0A1E5IGL5_ENDTX|nr:hypothetical protein ATZ36_09015 [Candidatus Endomicrobium trichonymphae]
MKEDLEMIAKEDGEWDKSRNAEWLILLENLSINNRVVYNESDDATRGDIIMMMKFVSNDDKLVVKYKGKLGSLNRKKKNSAFMPTSVLKTFDYLRYNSNWIGNRNMLQGDILEYMRLRGWESKNVAYRQIRRDLEFLSDIKMSYTGKNSFRMITPYGGDCGIKQGKFFFLLSVPFAEIYKKTHSQYVSPKMLKIDTHSCPPAYHIGKKLTELYSMNKDKANAGIVSIGSLLKGNPYISAYNSKIGNVYRNIINPTIRSLEALNSVFSFSNTSKLHEQNNILAFLSFKLKYMPINYPVPVLKVINA